MLRTAIEEQGTRKALQAYIGTAKKAINKLVVYKQQDMVNQLQGYLDKAAAMKKTLINPDDATGKY